MTEKQKPSKAPKAWRGKPVKTRPGYEHYGEPGPIRCPDSAGKRLGGWLFSLLTPWKR
jgi:hypothetical protein